MKSREIIKQLIGVSIWVTGVLIILKILNADNIEWFMVFSPSIIITLIISLYNFSHNKKFKKNDK